MLDLLKEQLYAVREEFEGGDGVLRKRKEDPNKGLAARKDGSIHLCV
jgi:hypothetical protein